MKARNGKLISGRKMLWQSVMSVPALATLAALAMPGSARAADQTWLGTTDGNWNTLTNWTNGALPNNSSAIFNNSTNTAINLANTVQLFGINVTTGASSFAFSGARFIAGGTSQSVLIASTVASSVITFNNDFQVTPGTRTSSYDWNFNNSSSTASMVFAGRVYGDVTQAGYSARLGINGAGNVTISGILSDVAPASANLGNVLVKKSSGGTLTLSNANTYSGGTEMANGTGSIVLGDKASLGTGALRLVGGSSTLQASTDLVGLNAIGNTINFVSTNNANSASINLTFTAGSNVATWTSGPAPDVGDMVTSVTTQLPYYARVTAFTGTAGSGTITFNANAGVAGTVTNLTTASFANGGTGTMNIGGAKKIEFKGAINLSTTSSTLAAVTQTFNVTNTDDTTFSGVLQEQAGAASIVKTGAGRLILTNTNLYTGTTSIGGGTLQLSGGAAIPDGSAVSLANIAGVLLDLNGTSETVESIAGGGTTGGSISLGAGTLTTSGSSNTTFSGLINGSGGYTRSGTGQIILSGANTYGGLTTVGNGRVTANSATALGASTGATASGLGSSYTQVSGTGTVAFGTALTINEAFQISGTGTSSSGALRFANQSTVINGMVQLTNDASVVSNGGGAGSKIAGNIDLNGHVLAMTGFGNAIISSAQAYGLTLDGTISGGTGSGLNFSTDGNIGTYNVTQSNSYTGTTTIAKTVGIGSDSAFGTSVVSFGIGNATPGAGTGLQSIDGNPRTLNNTLGTFGFGANVIFGQTSTQTGSLTFSNTTTSSLAFSAHTFTTNVDTTFANGFSNSTGIIKNGNATIFMNGANSYAGATTVAAGKLGGSGSFAGGVTIASAGTLSPGNNGTGVLTFGSTLGLAGATTLEINGTTRSTQYDGVNTTGALTYGGTLSLVFGGVVTPNATYDLFQIGAGGESGDFTSITVSGTYSIALTNNAGIWYGLDLIGDRDFTFSEATGDLTVTPEPSAIMAVGAMGAGLLGRRRRRRV